ncbi:MAG: HlyD family efflux transporter periplasmic adaptor subunit, partial [Planctomycetales bacterium]|nr:HlyD family efflux transporter periplasmic adaptor subunit [Planctomycetales bacterium]
PRWRAGVLVAATLHAAFGAACAEEVRVPSALLSPLHTLEVPAPEAGILTRLSLSEGQSVQARQTVGLVDPREQQLLVEVARQDLLVAQREAETDLNVRLAIKENKVAEAEYSRAVAINRELAKTVSEKEVDRLRLTFERTLLEIEHARFQQSLTRLKVEGSKADLRLAEDRVKRLWLVCPIAGVVSEIHARTGEWVDKGEDVVRVVTVDRLKLEGYVPVDAAAEGLVGRRVSIQTPRKSGSPLTARGRVVFVSPEAEPVNAQVRFWAEIDNRKLSLRPGLTASVVIHDQEEQRAAASGAPSSRPDEARR